LIVGGVLERLPNLRICFAHGGGAFPLVQGRVDKGFAVRSEMRVNIGKPPSDYARRIYVDSLVFDAASLRFVIDKQGADHVILGSDYPFGLGDDDPVETVQAADLPAGVVKRIIEDNVWDFLGRNP
jgi:aminocarboxymuconate-semialdehyde decarboxylase